MDITKHSQTITISFNIWSWRDMKINSHIKYFWTAFAQCSRSCWRPAVVWSVANFTVLAYFSLYPKSQCSAQTVQYLSRKTSQKFDAPPIGKETQHINTWSFMFYYCALMLNDPVAEWCRALISVHYRSWGRWSDFWIFATKCVRNIQTGHVRRHSVNQRN